MVLVGRHEQPLAEVAEACSGRATVLALDITSADAPEQIMLGAGGPIEVLVNNAGTSTVNTHDELTEADWQGQWELNVMAPMRLMRAVAPSMAGRGWGRIVNVCSSAGKRPSRTNMAYAVTKAAELSLSRAFADLYVTDGVLVNAVAPGPVASDMWMAPGGMADQLAEQRGLARPQALEAQAGRVPMGRFGTVDEIAGVIVFLCSEAASYVAGAAWSVDGGTVAVII